MNWKIGYAKQHLSDLIKQSKIEPQMIYNRENFVAVVIDAKSFKEWEKYKKEESKKTIGSILTEIREECKSESYELPELDRKNRESQWI